MGNSDSKEVKDAIKASRAAKKRAIKEFKANSAVFSPEELQASAVQNHAVPPLPRNCPRNEACEVFQAALAFQYTEEGYIHLTSQNHSRRHCRHELACQAFQRLLRGGEERLDDRVHCSMYMHPRIGHTFEESNVLQEGTKALQIGKQGPLDEELIRNGYGYVLNLQSENTLHHTVQRLLQHPRHKEMRVRRLPWSDGSVVKLGGPLKHD